MVDATLYQFTEIFRTLEKNYLIETIQCLGADKRREMAEFINDVAENIDYSRENLKERTEIYEKLYEDGAFDKLIKYKKSLTIDFENIIVLYNNNRKKTLRSISGLIVAIVTLIITIITTTSLFD